MSNVYALFKSASASSATPLKLRNISNAEVDLRHRIGRGWRLELPDMQGGPALLEIRQATQNTARDNLQWINLSSGSGNFSLPARLCESLLNHWSQAPFVTEPAETPDQQAWYTELYNALLDPGLRSLFGEIQPLGQSSAPITPTLAELKFQQGDVVITSPLAMPLRTFNHWLERGYWQSMPAASLGYWPVSAPLVLGHVRLPLEQFCSLSRGDVIVPKQPKFTPEGLGYLQLGPLQLGVFYQDEGTEVLLEVTKTHVITREAAKMHGDENNPDYQQGWDDQEQQGYDNYDQHQNFDQAYGEQESTGHEGLTQAMDTTLTIKIGEVSMTLDELQQVGPGSVLLVQGATPGEAGLYQGQRLIARGELVEVEGQLGLQLTDVNLPA
ncbi:FliM/FliN family flagellar motor switch protein [Pokkaliibacter sp. CJK22405]|uniref:FliM/FliN family flagellar motor switch protein n=1 Tax=Pokkaliibacter sp. CJK22405 TaxID=3384615 RepID=UPI0039851A19